MAALAKSWRVRQVAAVRRGEHHLPQSVLEGICGQSLLPASPRNQSPDPGSLVAISTHRTKPRNLTPGEVNPSKGQTEAGADAEGVRIRSTDTCMWVPCSATFGASQTARLLFCTEPKRNPRPIRGGSILTEDVVPRGVVALLTGKRDGWADGSHAGMAEMKERRAVAAVGTP